MKNVFILSFCLVAIGTISNAETQKELCAAIAPAMISASDAMASLGTALLSIDYGAITEKFTGPEADALRRLELAQAAMKPEFDEYLASLEDAAILMRKCAR